MSEIIPAGAPLPLRTDQTWDRQDPSPLDVLLAEWLIGYASPDTRRNYRTDLRYWVEFCAVSGLDPLLDVRRPHVEAWLRSLEAAGYSPATRARRIGSVSAFYGWCLDQDKVVRNPCHGIKRPQYDPDVAKQGGLSLPQLQALLEAARSDEHYHAPRDEFALLLMALLGLRVGSVCKANRADVTWYQGIRGLNAVRKGGRRKFVPFNASVDAACQRYLAHAARAPWTRAGVIVHRDQVGGPGRVPLFTLYDSAARITPSSLTVALRRIAGRADLPREIAERITPHWLRHTFVTLSLDAGVEQRHVQDAAGHASADTTRAYDQGRGSVVNHPTWRLQDVLAGNPAGTDNGVRSGP